MRFRVLGPLEVWTGEDWTPIGAPKWRSLLAALLVNAGQVVPTDRLIGEIWGDQPPRGATNLVAVYALKLRRMLGDEDSQLLRHRAPGYLLALKPDDVDSLRFCALTAAGRQALARQQPERAAALLTEALGLWRGDPYLDVPQSALVDPEAARLEAARLDALELSFGAEIGCGRYAEVTPELFRLTTDHPLREGLWGLLMRALDAAGRHAEALTVYARAREVIADELGVDPGEPLQALYEAILTEEPAPLRGQAPSPPPAQLPADIADFTGRTGDVERLCELLPPSVDDNGAVKIAVVAGAGGLGKTTLAVHAAHRLRPHFPDGQLYVNLLGATQQPLSPSDVLARFLRDLGVDAVQIPADEEERAGLVRTRLTGRRVLLLLDNAKDAAQVRPLLPGSASCVVLVTTRNRMPDLTVTRLVDLDVLDEEDARTLFTSIVGADRVGAGAAATDEVLAACAGLPLAIRIAGGRLAARPGWSVGTLATKLHSEQRRLDEFRVGDLAVRACFEMSYASLTATSAAASVAIDQARAFRLLGLWHGPTIKLDAAAALLGQSAVDAVDAVEGLVDAHLLESPAEDVYRFHDLLRVYAAERCQDEPKEARQDAIRRILAWYLHTAKAAAGIISPNYAPVPVGAAEASIQPLTFASLEEALDWSESEHTGLVAATRLAAASGLHDTAWRMAAAAMSSFYRRSQWVDWITTHEIGLSSAQNLGERQAEAWMLQNLGMAYGAQNRAEAVDYFEQALTIYRQIGDSRGEVRAAKNAAHAYLQQGRFDEALQAARNSLGIERQVGHRFGEGVALSILGAALWGLGRLEDSVDRFQQALAIYRELDDKQGEADALSELGAGYLSLLRVDEAIEALSESLAIWHSIGDRQGQATTLRVLGSAWRSAGKPDEARRCLAQAQQIFEELGDHTQAAEIRSELALLVPAGREGR